MNNLRQYSSIQQVISTAIIIIIILIIIIIITTKKFAYHLILNGRTSDLVTV